MQRKPWIAAGLCLLALCLAGCHRERSDWEKARAANDAKSYQQYLVKYPNGSFATQAQARLAQLDEDQDWQAASAVNTPDSYQAFLKQHPQGRWAEEARIRIENFALAQPPNAPPATASASSAAPAGHPPAAPPQGKPQGKPRAVPRAAARRSPARGGYGVQLGAFRAGKAAALRHWRVLLEHDRATLRGLHPRVSPLRTSSGRWVRLQVRGLTAARAAAICRRLRVRSPPCIVLKPARH
ncbi:MAG TPA: hypothetical protein VMU86_06355 [Steroidobacteraceae bacterium]|nr:hypothetical protein [Steroidobacteraceae bacterium]